MASVSKLLVSMRRSPRGVRFTDLCKVCDHYFGEPRHHGTSHRIYKTPWPGDPRVNIQGGKANAKAYQVHQVLAAIKRLESDNENG